MLSYMMEGCILAMKTIDEFKDANFIFKGVGR